ncbi:hypothetical protein ABPG74_020082 [Tetrahymena malaccensis]
MNKDLSCDIHTNYPLLFIDILENSSKKLKCGKCISDKKQQTNFLYIPDIINHKEDSFFSSWPPLYDEELRDRIINLKNENIDYNEKIIEFYDQLIEQIVKILSEKKKQQLIKASKIYEFKDKIVEQYCKLSEIEQLSQCLIQENLQAIQIEEKMKEIIDQKNYGQKYVHCFINHVLKPQKKYHLIIQFHKTNKDSCFYLGLTQDQSKHNKDLDSVGLGFQIQNFDTFGQNDKCTLQFKVCINDQLLQYGGFPNYSEFKNADISNQININEKYYFGLEFYNDYYGDKMEVISFNELDEFF